LICFLFVFLYVIILSLFDLFLSSLPTPTSNSDDFQSVTTIRRTLSTESFANLANKTPAKSHSDTHVVLAPMPVIPTVTGMQLVQSSETLTAKVPNESLSVAVSSSSAGQSLTSSAKSTPPTSPVAKDTVSISSSGANSNLSTPERRASTSSALGSKELTTRAGSGAKEMRFGKSFQEVGERDFIKEKVEYIPQDHLPGQVVCCILVAFFLPVTFLFFSSFEFWVSLFSLLILPILQISIQGLWIINNHSAFIHL
jgi:hypothetical protein